MTSMDFIIIPRNERFANQAFVASLKELKTAYFEVVELKAQLEIAKAHYKRLADSRSPEQQVQEANNDRISAQWGVTLKESALAKAITTVERFLSDDERQQMRELNRVIIVHEDEGLAPYLSTKMQYALFIAHGQYEVIMGISNNVMKLQIMQKQGSIPYSNYPTPSQPSNPS